ncbi:MAG: SusC/RagA family TonB-linked outer membrane protein, partial [Candidatus Nephrothrix sp. EaCA]
MDQKDLWYTPRDLGQSLRNTTEGTAQQRNDHWLNWQWDNTVTYNILADAHNLTALGGFSMQKNKWDYNQINAVGFATDDFSYKNIGGAYKKDQTNQSSDFQTNSIMSYIGRVNYSYKEKYFAAVTARYDGSSRFGDGHKWGLFPSLALSWNIAEENFFRSLNLRFVDLLKLRAGYGIAGNQNIPNFAYKTLYYPSFTKNTVSFNSDGRLGNPSLGWEKQKQVNLGVDVGLIQHKINLAFNYFSILNENLLLQRSLSTTTGFNNVISNVGTLKNEGIELAVNAKALETENFSWSVSANISSANNKVTKLYGNVDAIYNKGGYTGVEIQREGNL